MNWSKSEHRFEPRFVMSYESYRRDQERFFQELEAKEHEANELEASRALDEFQWQALNQYSQSASRQRSNYRLAQIAWSLFIVGLAFAVGGAQAAAFVAVLALMPLWRK